MTSLAPASRVRAAAVDLRAGPAALTVAVPALLLAGLLVTGLRFALPIAEALVAVGAIALVRRRPGAALGVLVVYLPLQQAVLSLLLRLGAPTALVRGLGAVKEVVVAGLVVAAVARWKRAGLHADALDRLTIAYLALLVAYVVLPYVLPGLFVDLPFSVRALAVRDDGLFALGFLGARHAGITAPSRSRIFAALTVTGVVIALTAMFEYLDPSAWNTFLSDDLQIQRYQQLIAGISLPSGDALVHGMVGSHAIIRVSGLLLSALTIGFVLLPALAWSLQRLSASRFRSTYAIGAVATGAAIIVTLTRSAILAGLLTTLVVLRLGFRRASPGRVRLLLALLIAVVLLAPLAGSSEPVSRIGSTFSSSDVSTQGHESGLQVGLDVLTRQPLGRGLGTAPSIGTRYDVSQRVTSEDAYLQVANEVGVETMIVFLLMIGLLVRGLARSTRLHGLDGARASAMLAAGIGLSVAGLFLHVWADFPTAVVFWALAGTCLGAEAEHQRGVPSTRVGASDKRAFASRYPS